MNRSDTAPSPTQWLDALVALLDASGPLSHEQLARATGLPPGETRRALEALAREDVELEDHGGRVRLAEAGLGVFADLLKHRHGRARRVAVYRRTASTQDAAARIAADSGRGADGALVVADEQTAGRGRLGRSWWTAPGRALAWTRVVARPASPEALVFGVSLAVAEAVEETSGLERVGLRWPNDLVVAGRKLGGILVESRTARDGTPLALVGIGLNVGVTRADLPDELRSAVTSLALLGAPVPRLRVLDAAVGRTDAALATPPTTPERRAAWRARSTLLGRRAVFDHRGERVAGEVIDLDPNAGLVVRGDTGVPRHLPAAETRLIETGSGGR